MTWFHFAVINLGALVAAAGGIFLKRLSNQLDHTSSLFELIFYVIKSPDFWLGGVCYVFPIFLWTYLLKYMELTKLQPLLSFVYIYTILFAMIFLGESPSTIRLMGIAFIIMGVVLVGRS